MESTSTAAWAGPYELQLAMNWPTAEEAPADDAQQVWAPAVGTFGSSYSLQPYVVPASASSISSGGPQLLDAYGDYAASPLHHYMNCPMKLFEERKKEFEDAYDAQFMKQKMHRYPRSIRDLDDVGMYTVPRMVAIGPYHHYGGGHLKQAEAVKHAAACHCITRSGLSVYCDVISAVNDSGARRLYHTDVTAAGLGGGDDCFLHMMFFDACFLVMYILKRSGENIDPTLYDFFESNDDDIFHDIMLLENQIPLQVLNAVMKRCTAEHLERMKRFIGRCTAEPGLLDRVDDNKEFPRVDWDQDYYNKAPHLLGLLRFYVVQKRRRRSSSKQKVSHSDLEKMESIRISAGAIELAEMGIFLTGNETTELPDMGLARKWIIFAELSMAPLSLNNARASWLVNMAALELCTTPDFWYGEIEESAVCSYLLLLCMLMHREEDVHELRTKGILQGGAGLNNKKTLDFFTSLQSLRKGRCYGHVMIEIQNYRNKRPWIKVYAFLYNNLKYIVAVGSAFGGFIGIIAALTRLRGAQY